MKENERKCYKCGCSPAQDPNITLRRFPKSGRTNSLRCELWAKYCFPHDSWSSPDFHNKLHSRHLMLCTKHFKRSSFIDNSGKRLVKSAAPDEECDKIILGDPNVIEPIAGPSVTIRPLYGNNQNTIVDPNVFEPVAGPSKTTQPLYENQNYTINRHKASSIPQSTEVSPIAAKNPLTTAKKDKHMLMKMKSHMRKINRLQKSLKNLRNESFLKVLSKNDSIHEILKCKISPTFALFLQGELQNFKKRPKGRRWNIDSKIIALRLYKRSPRCYKLFIKKSDLPADT